MRICFFVLFFILNCCNNKTFLYKNESDFGYDKLRVVYKGGKGLFDISGADAVDVGNASKKCNLKLSVISKNDSVFYCKKVLKRKKLKVESVSVNSSSDKLCFSVCMNKNLEEIGGHIRRDKFKIYLNGDYVTTIDSVDAKECVEYSGDVNDIKLRSVNHCLIYERNVNSFNNGGYFCLKFSNYPDYYPYCGKFLDPDCHPSGDTLKVKMVRDSLFINNHGLKKLN